MTDNVHLTNDWLAELDYWRGLAFLGVALQHVIGIFAHDPLITKNLTLALGVGLLFNLVKFAVPAFVLVSGLVLVRKYIKGLNTHQFYQKRFRELLIPYLLWSLIYQLYYTSGTGHPQINLLAWIYQSLTGTAAYHLWYVVLIIQFYLAFPLATPFFRWLQGTRHLWSVLLAAGLVYLLLMYLSFYVIPAHPEWMANHISYWLIKFRDRNLFFWWFYFLAGGAIALRLPVFYQHLHQYLHYYLLLWCLLMFWVTRELYPSILSQQLNLNLASSLKPSMFFFTGVSLALLFIVCLGLSDHPANFLVSLLKAFGRYSQGAYFIHALTLAAAMLVLRDFHITTTQPIFALFLAWLICTLLALLTTFMLSHLPGGHWLTGTVPGKAVRTYPQK